MMEKWVSGLTIVKKIERSIITIKTISLVIIPTMYLEPTRISLGLIIMTMKMEWFVLRHMMKKQARKFGFGVLLEQG